MMNMNEKDNLEKRFDLIKNHKPRATKKLGYISKLVRCTNSINEYIF